MISIGIGDWLNMFEIEAMASYPSDKNMFQVENFNAINDIVETIKEAICDSK